MTTTKLGYEESTRRKEIPRMTRRKRQYGTGCLLRRKGRWAIRWRKTEIGPDGTRKRGLRYETLGEMSRKQANDILTQRVVATSGFMRRSSV